MDSFKCLDCKVDTLEIQEYYMVNDDLWTRAVPSYNGMLCIECLENRLGRRLTPPDFTSAPINESIFGQSNRLRSRIEGYSDHSHKS